MTHIAINACAARGMTVHAPSHGLLNFAAHSMHLANLTMTRRTLDTGSNVWLVSVERVRFRLEPIHASPRRLLFSFSISRELLDLWAFGLDRFVTAHASAYVWNSGVRRFIGVFVTKSALELRSVVPFFRDVLPVIELDRLHRSGRLAAAQQHEPDHRYDQNQKH